MTEINQQIIVDLEARVAKISLNRAPANGYYLEFLEYLNQQLELINKNEEIKVILIQSLNEKFFCAGADIKIFANHTTKENSMMVRMARKVSHAISASDKIVVAAVRGHTLGGGLEMIMACDLRLASKGNYLIGLPEVKLGLMPGNGGTPRLIDLIGASRAMELLVTGDSIDPLKAYDYGLFNQLYEKNEFEEQVNTYVKKLSEGPKHAMSAIKKYVRNHKGMGLQESLERETFAVDTLYETDDAKEGFQAFVEKRKARF